VRILLSETANCWSGLEQSGGGLGPGRGLDVEVQMAAACDARENQRGSEQRARTGSGTVLSRPEYGTVIENTTAGPVMAACDFPAGSVVPP